MNKWLKLGTMAAVLAIASLMVLGTAAFAQGPTPQTTPVYGQGLHMGYGMGMGAGQMGGSSWGGPRNSLVAVGAKVLGLSQTDLVAELNSGKTIADVAKDKGISTDTIVNEFLAARAATLKSAVDAGRITQPQADTVLATMRTNVTAQLTNKWTPRGPGQGTGFVDANGDGICDNYGTNHPAGTTGGLGNRGRWNR